MDYQFFCSILYQWRWWKDITLMLYPVSNEIFFSSFFYCLILRVSDKWVKNMLEIYAKKEFVKNIEWKLAWSDVVRMVAQVVKAPWVVSKTQSQVLVASFVVSNPVCWGTRFICRTLLLLLPESLHCLPAAVYRKNILFISFPSTKLSASKKWIL